MTMADIGTVLITGAQGNLGRKLIAHLVAFSWCERVIGVDRAIRQKAGEESRVRWVEGDLGDPKDRRWRDALSEADAVVHLAARNPYPDAPWEDAVASFDRRRTSCRPPRSRGAEVRLPDPEGRNMAAAYYRMALRRPYRDRQTSLSHIGSIRDDKR